MDQPFYISVQAILKTPRQSLAAHKTKFSDGTACDIWALPGGKMAEGESELDTINRELKEELDFAIKDYKPRFVNYVFPGGTQFKFKDGMGIIALVYEILIPEIFAAKTSVDYEDYLWIDNKKFLEKKFFSIKMPLKNLYKQKILE